MDAETLEALKGSIKKHENILAGLGEDLGIKNCPLCQMFHDAECDGCPVAEKSGEQYCNDTPYDLWGEHQDREHNCGGTIECPECERLVKLEIEFLKSLLPPTTI